MSMLKTYTYSDFFLNSRKKWVKHKLETFSQIYINMFSQVNLENQSLRKRKTEIHVEKSDINFQTVSLFNITPV